MADLEQIDAGGSSYPPQCERQIGGSAYNANSHIGFHIPGYGLGGRGGGPKVEKEVWEVAFLVKLAPAVSSAVFVRTSGLGALSWR
jgi:hypothetical protein